MGVIFEVTTRNSPSTERPYLQITFMVFCYTVSRYAVSSVIQDSPGHFCMVGLSACNGIAQYTFQLLQMSDT